MDCDFNHLLGKYRSFYNENICSGIKKIIYLAFCAFISPN